MQSNLRHAVWLALAELLFVRAAFACFLPVRVSVLPRHLLSGSGLLLFESGLATGTFLFRLCSAFVVGAAWVCASILQLLTAGWIFQLSCSSSSNDSRSFGSPSAFATHAPEHGQASSCHTTKLSNQPGSMALEHYLQVAKQSSGKMSENIPCFKARIQAEGLFAACTWD